MSSWPYLTEELNHWRDNGATATFWWRDDDAVEPTQKLENILNLALNTPLAFAVIPARATKTLAEKLREYPAVAVLQHGWNHKNWDPKGNNEYPANRSKNDISQELARGRVRLEALFGPQFMPVFVPPWHAFDHKFLPLLPQNGLCWISRKGPRAEINVTNGLRQINVHVPLIAWSDPPSFNNEDFYLEKIVRHLRGRRLGLLDASEPTGLLTHHLVQNNPSYDFISKLIEKTSDNPAAAWLNPRKLFAVHFSV